MGRRKHTEWVKLIDALTEETKDCTSWGIGGFADAPEGQGQEGASKASPKIWIRQSGDDDFGFTGTMYLPVGNRFLKVWYNA